MSFSSWWLKFKEGDAYNYRSEWPGWADPQRSAGHLQRSDRPGRPNCDHWISLCTQVKSWTDSRPHHWFFFCVSKIWLWQLIIINSWFLWLTVVDCSIRSDGWLKKVAAWKVKHDCPHFVKQPEDMFVLIFSHTLWLCLDQVTLGEDYAPMGDVFLDCFCHVSPWRIVLSHEVPQTQYREDAE